MKQKKLSFLFLFAVAISSFVSTSQDQNIKFGPSKTLTVNKGTNYQDQLHVQYQQ